MYHTFSRVTDKIEMPLSDSGVCVLVFFCGKLKIGALFFLQAIQVFGTHLMSEQKIHA